MTATTALTAQNTLGVKDIHHIPPEFLRKQIDAVCDDVGVDVVKTGNHYSVVLIIDALTNCRYACICRVDRSGGRCNPEIQCYYKHSGPCTESPKDGARHTSIYSKMGELT
jgi:hypothetical protein